MANYEIVIATHDPQLAKPVQQSLHPLTARVFNGKNSSSFSTLINRCVATSNAEIVIICSYKVRPTAADVEKMLDLINQGYGMVCLYRFAFFGFRKELFRRVGFLDERYVQGGYEDSDMLRLVLLNDIAYYEDECVPYTVKRSTWKYARGDNRSLKHFKTKWLDDLKNHRVVQLIPNEEYAYELGPSNPKVVFLDRTHSKLMTPNFEKNSFSKQF